jgi:transposase
MDRACTAAEFKRGQGASWGITKAGNGYLRQMLMVGAMAVIRYAQRDSARRPGLVQLMRRRPTKVAAIALANKTARTVWALMSSGERYRDPQAMQATVSTAA